SGSGRAGWPAAAGCRPVGAKKRSPRPPRARARQALSRRAAVDGGLLPASRSTDISFPFFPPMLDLHLELGILRAPPERLDGPGRVGNQLRRISGPSRDRKSVVEGQRREFSGDPFAKYSNNSC